MTRGLNGATWPNKVQSSKFKPDVEPSKLHNLDAPYGDCLLIISFKTWIQRHFAKEKCA